ncbi:MAG: 2-oxo acid dehydrogenase subunit E2 [Chloroflexi bacterium]|nr:2-oxo acid dehydrogenase subunit E2 [Chloroflexota bacterium]
MSSNFHLPPLPNTSEVTIGRWLKQPGDQVIASENLVEVYSEQYDWDIPSPRAGTLQEIRVPAGGCARPGDVIAVLDGSASEPEVAAPRANQRVSPLAARMAAAHGIDTVSIKGTGVGERVTKNDLLAFIQAHTPPPVPPPAVSADVLVALTPAHAAMADLLARSKESMPHVSSFVEVDMGRILAQRDARQAAWRNREGFELTTTPYLILAAVAALRAVPVVNGMFSPAGAVLKKSINIGVTIAADGGSVTPMLQNAETYNLVGIARRVAGRHSDHRDDPPARGGNRRCAGHPPRADGEPELRPSPDRWYRRRAVFERVQAVAGNRKGVLDGLA